MANNSKKQNIVILCAILTVVLLGLTAVASYTINVNGQPSSSQEITSSSVYVYEDEYLKLIKEYKDVLIPPQEPDQDNYMKQTLFVGDSNTNALSAFGHLYLQNVLGKSGMAIQRVASEKCMWFVDYPEPVDIPTAVGMLKPRRIIMNFGTNNAGYTSTEEFIRSYSRTIDIIKKAYPYADVIVAAIFPVAEKTSYKKITKECIDEYNLALAQMCRDKELKFLNTAEVFIDRTNGYIKSEYIGRDGVHLSADGLRAYLGYVETHKYVTEDKRPARDYIPTRTEPPQPTEEPVEVQN